MILILLFIPLISCILIWTTENIRIIKSVVLSLSIVNLMFTLLFMLFFKNDEIGYQYMVGDIIGIDGISLWLIWLVNMFMPILLLSSNNTVNTSIPLNLVTPFGEFFKVNTTRLFFTLLILTGFWSIMVFMVLDLLIFYISFEGTLIPIYLLIQFFGSRSRKVQAGYEFFLYTLFGSLFLFLGILILYLEIGTTNYTITASILSTNSLNSLDIILWIIFFMCFAVKIPVFGVHLWLLKAHVEANAQTSAILAAILLKLGSFGLIRYSLPLFPLGTEYFRSLVIILSLMGIIYTSMSAIVQSDMKLIIAYSSIGHMAAANLGLFSNDLLGIQASIFSLISHGLISGGLFLLIGILYDRFHTRTIKYFRGLVIFYPLFVVFFLLFSLANSAVPLTTGFISEFFILSGVFNMNPFIGFLTATSIVLVPIFMLNLFHRISYGRFSSYMPIVTSDITISEFHFLIPLVFFILLLGIFPNLLMDDILLPSSALVALFFLFKPEKLVFGINGILE